MRSRRSLRAENASLTAEVASLRLAVADLGRRLHGRQQVDRLADTAPMPRVRSQAPSSWPPEGWRPR